MKDISKRNYNILKILAQKKFFLPFKDVIVIKVIAEYKKIVDFRIGSDLKGHLFQFSHFIGKESTIQT